MAEMLFESARGGTAFRVIQAADGHLLIQEDQGYKRRSYRTTGAALDAIQAAEDPFEAATAAYNQARLKKARRRAKGAGGGGR